MGFFNLFLNNSPSTELLTEVNPGQAEIKAFESKFEIGKAKRTPERLMTIQSILFKILLSENIQRGGLFYESIRKTILTLKSLTSSYDSNESSLNKKEVDKKVKEFYNDEISNIGILYVAITSGKIFDYEDLAKITSDYLDRLSEAATFLGKEQDFKRSNSELINHSTIDIITGTTESLRDRLDNSLMNYLIEKFLDNEELHVEKMVIRTINGEKTLFGILIPITSTYFSIRNDLVERSVTGVDAMDILSIKLVNEPTVTAEKTDKKVLSES